MSLPYAIEFDHFYLNFASRRILTDIHLAIPAGACVGIIGPNGSGKTSLLRSIAGLNQPSSGCVRIFGRAPSRAWRRQQQIGYVPQLKSIDREFPISVYEVVMLGRTARMGISHYPCSTDHDKVRHALEKVNLTAVADRPIGQLSGGQLQRVFIARALAQEATVLLLDEPETGLDIPTQQSIYGLLEQLHDHKVTTVTTTHDLLALEFHRFDRIICLNQQVIGYGQPHEVLVPEVLSRTFAGYPWLSEDVFQRQTRSRKEDGK